MNQLKQFQKLSGLFKVAGGVGAVGYLGYNSLFSGIQSLPAIYLHQKWRNFSKIASSIIFWKFQTKTHLCNYVKFLLILFDINSGWWS